LQRLVPDQADNRLEDRDEQRPRQHV
jgi:hypothetical protein